MYDNDSKGISFTAGFFMLIAFTIAGLFVALIISKPIWTGMTGLPALEMEKGLSDPANSNVAKILQAIQAIFGFFIPTVVTAFLLNRKPLRLIGFSPRVKISQAGLVVLIVITAMIVSSSLYYFNNSIPFPDSWKITFDEWEKEYNERAVAIVGLKSPAEYVLALIVMAFLPALCEETLFRGGLQNFLTRATKNPWVSVLIASFIFSAIHLSGYLFLPRLFLGVVLGLVYHYSGRIWLCIFAHFLNNAYVITVLYISQRQGKSLKEALVSEESSWWGILALPIVIGLLLVFKRISFNSKPQY